MPILSEWCLILYSLDRKRVVKRYEATESVTFGRGAKAQVRLNEKGISNYHAVLKSKTVVDSNESLRWYLEDVSTFFGMGVMVNGIKFDHYQEVRKGDRIEIGVFKNHRRLIVLDNVPIDLAQPKPEENPGFDATTRIQTKILSDPEVDSTEVTDNSSPLSLESIRSELKQLRQEFNKINSLYQKTDSSLQKTRVFQQEMIEKLNKKTVIALQLRNRLKNIVRHVEEELTCSICLSVLDKMVMLTCQHSFCSDCLDKWLKQKWQCPYCRAAFISATTNTKLNNLIGKIMTEGRSFEESFSD